MANAAIGRSRDDEARRIRREEEKRRLERIALGLLNLAVLAIALTVLIVVLSLFGGCVSVAGRCLGAWGEPYYATRMVYDFASKRGEPSYYAWVPFEAAADTVFLPADALVKWIR